MIKKAISYGILLISTGIGLGIAISSRDIVSLYRRKINIRHQETVNNQRITLYNDIMDSELEEDRKAEYKNKITEHIKADDEG